VPGKKYGCHGHGCGGNGWARARRRPSEGLLPSAFNNTHIYWQDFERKSALFSLAFSEILIVNLWEHQVGLYQGANMGLLKTVFEVNLGLFGKKSSDG